MKGGGILALFTIKGVVMNKVYDVAVIGAGPAGLTAALYAARAGLSVAFFERMGAGGQMTSTEHLDNYPGFTDGIDPFTLSFQMAGQAERFGAEQISADIVKVDLESETKVLEDSAGTTYEARTVVLAMGARPRLLGVDREEELTGKGVSYCAACDGGFFRGKSVVVVGGGNTAVGDVLYLSRLCEQVYHVHRRDEMRADAVYVDALQSLENYTFFGSHKVVEVKDTDGVVSQVVIQPMDAEGDTDQKTLDVAALFVAVGTQPKNDIIKDSSIEMDKAGYVVADESCVTSIPGVFVAGDLRTKTLRQVVTATSDGAIAATAAFDYLSTK